MADQNATFLERMGALTQDDPAVTEARRRLGTGMAVNPQTPATNPNLVPVDKSRPGQLPTGTTPPPDLPPEPKFQDFPKPMPTDERNPLEVFDVFKNPAIVLASLGSLFTRGSLTTAFNSAAGAINGFRNGQKQVFEQQKEVWQQAAEKAREQNAMELTKYKVALEQRDMKARMAALYEIAAQSGDTTMQAFVRNGDMSGAYDLYMKRESLQDNLVKSMQMIRAKEAETEAEIEHLKKDPNVVRDAEEIANYKKPGYTNVLRNPRSTATMAVVEEMSEKKGTPYDQSLYGTRVKTENAFTTGAESKTVRALNNAIGHLATVDRLIDALNNKDLPLFNRIMQAAQIHTGTGQAITNFNMAREIVGGEIEKAVVVGGGTGGERENIRQQFAAISSPDMMHGPVNVARELLARQFEGLKKQYESGGGQKDFDNAYMLPDTQRALKKAESGSGSSGEISGWTYEEVK